MMHSWKKQKSMYERKKKEYLWALSFITSKWIIKKKKPPFYSTSNLPHLPPSRRTKTETFHQYYEKDEKTCSDFYLLYLLIQNKPLYDLIL